MGARVQEIACEPPASAGRTMSCPRRFLPPLTREARIIIISGLYPTSTGAEHMRSMTKLPANMHMFPHYLRMLGYYCTNKVKEDYNLEKTGKVWDDSSNKAHYKNRPGGAPFFAVFNSI